MVIEKYTLFVSRNSSAEELYFKADIRPGDTVVALTDGGIEVAYPSAFLQGARLQLIDSPLEVEGFAQYEGFVGRHVWLFDDGEAGDELLCRAARALRFAGAATVGVASVVASRRLRCMAGPGVIDQLYVVEWRERLPDGAALWAEPAHPAGYWLRRMCPAPASWSQTSARCLAAV